MISSADIIKTCTSFQNFQFNCDIPLVAHSERDHYLVSVNVYEDTVKCRNLGNVDHVGPRTLKPGREEPVVGVG